MRASALSAQTHSRLAEANWSGVSLETVLLDELAPYRHEDGANVRASGPPTMLNAKHALTLGMAMHELATNAAKYGALSTENGVVDISWEIDGEQLKIVWTESGGPPVTPPTRNGFGRLLIERVLASDLDGTVEVDFAGEGLNAPLPCRWACTCRQVKPSELDHARPMNGLRVLIVEDEFLLAMSLEDDLVSAGCSPIGPFSNLASATEATRREEFDLAILDVNLNGEAIFRWPMNCCRAASRSCW